MNLRSSFAIGVLVASQCGGMPPGCSATNPRTPVLRIHLYDLASVPEPTLRRALAEAMRLFVVTGIELAWNPGKADELEAHTLDMSALPTSRTEQADERDFLVVRLLGDFAPARPGALGFSLPNAQMGAHVTLIYRRIDDVALSMSIAAGTVLGHALAHEIGHVLLRSDKHSQAGIMKGVWSNTDYGQLAAEHLNFARCEAVVMRKEVLRRLCFSPTQQPRIACETAFPECGRNSFRRALSNPGNRLPRVINVDKNRANPVAVEELKEQGMIRPRCKLRQCKYLNNIVEQDHRTVKQRPWLAKGYGSVPTACRILRGIEAMEMIRSGEREG